MKRASWTLLFVAGCGGSAPAGGTTPAEETSPEASAEEEEVPLSGMPEESAIEMLGITGPDKPWEEMSLEEREWYMVGKVHPIMREVFAKFDPKYGSLECVECHGEDGKERNYEMPNPSLSAVPAFDSEDFKAMQGSKLVTFMREEVTVTTAKLLGQQPYDPATGKGFTCFDCHPKE